ncbi:hypothetical protein JW979_01605 [bacterium]|nr:hypothetical protein [candidate division CSSED10-310 bacterium]
MRRLSWVILGLFWCIALNAMSVPIEITTETDVNAITVGEPIKLTVKITVPEETRILFPSKADLNIDPFIVLETEHHVSKIASDRVEEIFIVTTSISQTGNFEIPAFEISYEMPSGEKGTVNTEPVFIKIISILSESNNQPKDIKAPLTFKARWMYIMGVLATVIVLCIILIYLIFWMLKKISRKKLETKLREPELPADVVALKALEALNSKQYLEKRDIKQFFVDLIEIFKRYLGKRYAIVMLERTTGEIKRDLSTAVINNSEAQEIIDILQLADYVKFAKYRPAKAICQETFERVRQFILKTRELSLSENIQSIQQVVK